MTAIFVDQAIADLQANVRGELIRPGTPAYDEARRVRNGLIDRCPALIARCAGTADVVAAVTFARRPANSSSGNTACSSCARTGDCSDTTSSRATPATALQPNLSRVRRNRHQAMVALHRSAGVSRVGADAGLRPCRR